MTRFLLKPLVYLLVFGILGCTTTNWTVLNQPTSQEFFSLLRITLIDGEKIELINAMVKEESVSGTRGYRAGASPGKHFTVQTSLIRAIEIGDRQTGSSKISGSYFLWVIVPIILVVGALIIACQVDEHNCDRDV